MIHLIEQQIITRFGVPSIFKFYSGLYSRSMDIVDFSLDKEIHLRYSSNYYPRGNGVAESMNKNLLGIIGKKCIIKAWHNAPHVVMCPDVSLVDCSSLSLI